MSDDYQRKSDEQIAVLSQKFEDFIARYERDRLAFEKKYDADWEHTQSWRKSHYGMIVEIKAFTDKVQPAYKLGMGMAWATIIGSIGILLKIFWAHLKWN